MHWNHNTLAKIHHSLQYTLQHNTYYRQLWQNIQLTPLDISSCSDLQKIPLTDKETVQQHLNSFTCVAKSEIIEYTCTSGTLGLPLSIPLTENDLKRLARNEQTSFQRMEVNKQDTVQLMLTLDRQFMAGMAYYNGLRSLGASIIRTGPGLPGMQWDSIMHYQTTVLVGVPSFILKLMHYAIDHAIPYQQSSVQKILVIGESLFDARIEATVIAQKIKQLWPSVQLYNTYASTEMQTAYTACNYNTGMHENPELIITEIIDEDGRQVPLGTMGEICITTLGIEGLPLIRYRTGDMTIAQYHNCACGFQGLSIGGIEARKKQLLKIKGTTIYPNSIFNVLNDIPLIQEYYIEAFTNNEGLDDVIIYYASENDINIDSIIRQKLQAKLRLKLQVMQQTITYITQKQFPDNSRKQIKFSDKRKKTN